VKTKIMPLVNEKWVRNWISEMLKHRRQIYYIEKRSHFNDYVGQNVLSGNCPIALLQKDNKRTELQKYVL